MTAIALTIAGSDSSGGAGIQADLKTFAAFAVFGTSAITALTAQNTLGVRAIVDIDPAFVAAQIDAIADDFTIAAAKTGMLSRAEIIGSVADRISIHKISNLVVDPVMVTANGDVLLEPAAIVMMRDVMLPMATLVTPNLREASILTGREILNRDSMREAARALVGLGARAALVKSGSRCSSLAGLSRIRTQLTFSTMATISASFDQAGFLSGAFMERAARFPPPLRRRSRAENLWKMRLTQGNGT